MLGEIGSYSLCFIKRISEVCFSWLEVHRIRIIQKWCTRLHSGAPVPSCCKVLSYFLSKSLSVFSKSGDGEAPTTFVFNCVLAVPLPLTSSLLAVVLSMRRLSDVRREEVAIEEVVSAACPLH